MSETKVDWSKAPEGATYFAFTEFRKGTLLNVDAMYYDTIYRKWMNAGFSFEECTEASDFEERPPQYDQSQDEKWDNGKLGRDEEHVRVAELPDSVFNNAVKNTPYVTPEATPDVTTGAIRSNGGSSSYYDIYLPDWLIDLIVERRYIKTEELIEVMGDSFNQGTILKSLVRLNSLLNGVGKAGNTVEYECNKVIYYANRIKEEQSR